MIMIFVCPGGWLSASAICYSFPRKCLFWSLLTQHSIYGESLHGICMHTCMCGALLGMGVRGPDYCQTKQCIIPLPFLPQQASILDLSLIPPQSSSSPQPTWLSQTELAERKQALESGSHKLN